MFLLIIRLVTSTSTLLQSYLKEERRVRLDRLARHHHVLEVCCLTALEVLNKLKSEELNFLHIRDNAENLVGFSELFVREDFPGISKVCTWQQFTPFF